MADWKGKQTRDALLAQLQTIDGTGGYRTDLASGYIRAGIQSVRTLPRYPAAMVLWGVEEMEEDTEGLHRKETTMNVPVMLVDKGSDVHAADEKLANLRADVEVAVELPMAPTNRPLGLGHIRAVTVVGVDPVETDEATSRDGIAAWVLTVECTGVYTRGDP